uniref:FMN-dependent dehydrogenase domain-containing protein n=1 Tax=Physcomitrium patens TaxID=3218 RepID=A0A2K1JL18_PHYPA|nr:hypothetical protein PHYPA_017046 [Physcomitrium patens]
MLSSAERYFISSGKSWLVPRILVDVSNTDVTSKSGTKIAMPMLLASVAHHKLTHPDDVMRHFNAPRIHCFRSRLNRNFPEGLNRDPDNT